MNDELGHNSRIDIQLTQFEQHYRVAAESYERSDYESAQNAFERCIYFIEVDGLYADEQIPEVYYPVVTDIRALVYSGYGDTLRYGFTDLAGATAAYGKALQYQPGEKTLTFQYVEALCEQGSYKEGIAVVEDLLRRRPSDIDGLLIMANLYWCVEEGARAFKYALECIRLCEEWDHSLNTWIRDPEYYASARGLIEEILLVDGEGVAEN